MQQMNKVMDPQKTAKMMQEFERENAKMGMSEEMSKNSFLHFSFLFLMCVLWMEFAMIMTWNL